jgi:hypothetical protein
MNDHSIMGWKLRPVDTYHILSSGKSGSNGFGNNAPSRLPSMNTGSDIRSPIIPAHTLSLCEN